MWILIGVGVVVLLVVLLAGGRRARDKRRPKPRDYLIVCVCEMWLRIAIGMTFAGAGLALAGCGGRPANRTLSPGEYRAALTTLAGKASRAQAQAEKALQARTVAEIRMRLTSFANVEHRVGEQVAALHPPLDARAANALLARGERDAAAELRALLPKLSKLKTPEAALSFLDRRMRGGKSVREVTKALSKLRELGYIPGG